MAGIKGDEMTHEGARNEAIRRTEALQTTHYVVSIPAGFLVLANVPAKYQEQIVKVVRVEDVAALKANTVGVFS